MEKGKYVRKRQKTSASSVDDSLITNRQRAKRLSTNNGFIRCHLSCCCSDGAMVGGCNVCRPTHVPPYTSSTYVPRSPSGCFNPTILPSYTHASPVEMFRSSSTFIAHDTTDYMTTYGHPRLDIPAFAKQSPPSARPSSVISFDRHASRHMSVGAKKQKGVSLSTQAINASVADQQMLQQCFILPSLSTTISQHGCSETSVVHAALESSVRQSFSTPITADYTTPVHKLDSPFQKKCISVQRSNKKGNRVPSTTACGNVSTIAVAVCHMNASSASSSVVQQQTTVTNEHSVSTCHGLIAATSYERDTDGVNVSATYPFQDFYAPAEYIDIGDCSEVCIYCGAAFWNAERLKEKIKTARPVYHGCCCGGKVRLPPESDPPEYLRNLLHDHHFIENIRAYNQMFAMTSFGAKIDDTINNGRSPYVFKLSGQVYHWIGSLCPSEGDPPRFLQLYIHDTQHEVANRLKHFTSTAGNCELRTDIVDGIMKLLDTHNDLIQLFRTARDKCLTSHIPDFKIKLYSLCGARGYELPISDAIGAIVLESGITSCTDYDVVIELKGGSPQRINKLHPSYMSLQFPLLFVYGQHGYHLGLKMRTSLSGKQLKRMSMNAYYNYQIHQRDDNFDLLFRSGRLFQQYLVSVYCCIEQNRMDFLRANQKDIRREYLSGVYDAILRGDREGSEIGSRVILPSSFTGGPRYMYSHYLDALAICRVLGNPQFFITFTCNIKWPEIRRHMEPYPHLTPNDRADIISRVFQQKVVQLMKYLRKERPFGTVTGVLYTIEFQKRGLPHCHMLLWLSSASKIVQPQDIDKYISTEIPDPVRDPDGYRVISELMLHGPCGSVKPNAPCMQEGQCSKKFPKKYNSQTFFDKDGHIHYQRRETDVYVSKHSIDLDNTYVVPFNRMLCLIFYAHINVEYCGWSMLIKYLFKYISKGTDRVLARITRPSSDIGQSTTRDCAQVDEIQSFIDGRYICPHEASWRILNFGIHHREPAVQILSVHLPDMQSLQFRSSDQLGNVVSDSQRKKTTLTEWLSYNREYSDGKDITYLQFPSQYVWHSDGKYWAPRKNKTKSSVGRIAYVHPACGELFYLRLLLCHKKGSACFTDLRTVNNILHLTHRAACHALGLLGDDKEWEIAIEEESYSSTSSELRSLFVQIIVYCDVSEPIRIWDQHWIAMSNDIITKVTRQFAIPHLTLSTPDLQGYVLYELEILFATYGKCLQEYGLPSPPAYLLENLKNRLLMEERGYDRDALTKQTAQDLPRLNKDQRVIYDLIIQSSDKKEQQLIFVYGHGGTGKTFLWNTIISSLRASGKIVLAVASSGIASLLLPSGRTAHSRFNLPLDLTNESLCRIRKHTQVAQLLKETDLIIRDKPQ